MNNSRMEAVVNCPVCGGPNSIRNRFDPSVPETKDCTFCDARGSVPRSVAAEYEVEQYEAFKRRKGAGNG